MSPKKFGNASGNRRITDAGTARAPNTWCWERWNSNISSREVALFNPRKQRWFEHFRWTNDGTTIQGRTACGRATVNALQLNNMVAVTVRRYWIQARWRPPRDEC